MLNHKGFDLWADGYDKSVGLSDEANTYPFAGYKKVLAAIFQTVMQTGRISHPECSNWRPKKCRARIYIRATLRKVW